MPSTSIFHRVGNRITKSTGSQRTSGETGKSTSGTAKPSEERAGSAWLPSKLKRAPKPVAAHSPAAVNQGMSPQNAEAPRDNALMALAPTSELQAHREIWNNWGISDNEHTLHGYAPMEKMLRPSTREEIAQAIQYAEKHNKVVRAVGSGMSFSDAVLPQSTAIDQKTTKKLWGSAVAGKFEPTGDEQGVLLKLTDHFGMALDTSAFDKSLQASLPGLLKDEKSADSLFFVEAGIKINSLNELLDNQSPRRLALRTMGGASEQSLAGAFSTGTHGGDYDRPPLADNVRALYMIGAGGVHHWIEPSDSLTRPEKIAEAFPEIRPENIHYDDDMYRASLVSMGAMGVIYAAIVDVVPQYSLLQWNRWSTWEDLKKDTESDEFKSLLDGSWSGMKPFVEEKFGNEASPNRFVQVVINPIKSAGGSHQCFVTNRAELPLRETSGSPPADIGEVFQKRDVLLKRIYGSPQFGAKEAFNFAVAFARRHFAGAEAEVSQKLVSLCKKKNYPWVVREVTGLIMEHAFPASSAGSEPYIDVGWKVMAPSRAGAKAYPALGGTSVESAFAFVPDISEFVDQALKVLDEGAAGKDRLIPVGWLSVRLTGQSKALLGMQRAPVSGMVEVALLGNDDDYEIVKRMEHLTRERGGALHWGQSNGLFEADDVEKVYGKSAVDRWKTAQRFLGAATFTNHFMQRLGLNDPEEPLTQDPENAVVSVDAVTNAGPTP